MGMQAGCESRGPMKLPLAVQHGGPRRSFPQASAQRSAARLFDGRRSSVDEPTSRRPRLSRAAPLNVLRGPSASTSREPLAEYDSRVRATRAKHADGRTESRRFAHYESPK